MSDRPLRPSGRRPVAPAAALDALAGLADLAGGESDRSRRFLGGLVAGALVGAVVVGAAGSALVRRGEAAAPHARDDQAT